MPLPDHIQDDKRFGLVIGCERCLKRIARVFHTESNASWTLRRKEFIRVHWDCPKSKTVHKLDKPRE